MVQVCLWGILPQICPSKTIVSLENIGLKVAQRWLFIVGWRLDIRIRMSIYICAKFPVVQDGAGVLGWQKIEVGCEIEASNFILSSSLINIGRKVLASKNLLHAKYQVKWWKSKVNQTASLTSRSSETEKKRNIIKPDEDHINKGMFKLRVVWYGRIKLFQVIWVAFLYRIIFELEFEVWE